MCGYRSGGVDHACITTDLEALPVFWHGACGVYKEKEHAELLHGEFVYASNTTLSTRVTESVHTRSAHQCFSGGYGRHFRMVKTRSGATSTQEWATSAGAGERGGGSVWGLSGSLGSAAAAAGSLLIMCLSPILLQLMYAPFFLHACM